MARAYYMAIAAIAIDECRIERTLWSEGYEGNDRAQDLSFILPEALQNFRDAIELRYPSEPIDRTYESAVREFNQLSTHMAYVTAEPSRLKEPAIALAKASASWDRLISGHWLQFEACLEPIPDARVRVEHDEFDSFTHALADQHEAWFEHIGFRIEEMGEGAYFHVLRQDF